MSSGQQITPHRGRAASSDGDLRVVRPRVGMFNPHVFDPGHPQNAQLQQFAAGPATGTALPTTSHTGMFNAHSSNAWLPNAHHYPQAPHNTFGDQRHPPYVGAGGSGIPYNTDPALIYALSGVQRILEEQQKFIGGHSNSAAFIRDSTNVKEAFKLLPAALTKSIKKRLDDFKDLVTKLSTLKVQGKQR